MTKRRREGSAEMTGGSCLGGLLIFGATFCGLILGWHTILAAGPFVLAGVTFCCGFLAGKAWSATGAAVDARRAETANDAKDATEWRNLQTEIDLGMAEIRHTVPARDGVK